MPTDILDIASRLVLLLQKASMHLQRAQHVHTITEQGGAFGDLHHDTETGGDDALKAYFYNELAQEPHLGRITIEGLAPETVRSGDLWVTCDPLDGSLNHLRQIHGQMILPYMACLTLLATKDRACFRDILIGAATDLRTGDVWIATRDDMSHSYTTKHVAPSGAQRNCTTLVVDHLDIGAMHLMAEMYYPQGRPIIAHAFAEEKGWIRDLGSSMASGMCVADGIAAGYISPLHKQHELGAIYALVKGAGGVICDWNGQDLGSYTYDFITQIPLIAAANRSIAKEIQERLQQAIKKTPH